MEPIGASIKGIYRDIFKDRDNRIIFDSGWVSNKIVHRCRTLLAAFMKNDRTKGIQRLKIGKGKPEWDNTGAQVPDESVTGLEDEAPFTIDVKDKIAYLNENDVEVNVPTNRLQVTATLEVNQPEPPADSNLSSYPMREFGLFGVYVDESDEEHEYMIDCIRHPRIDKDVNTTLVRVVRLYF